MNLEYATISLANNILCFHYGICKDYPAILPQINNQRKANTVQNIHENGLKAYPNPANEWLTFDYSNTMISESTWIEISDITGKNIAILTLEDKQKSILWDTRNTAEGVYMYKLIRDGHPTSVGKFVIQH